MADSKYIVFVTFDFVSFCDYVKLFCNFNHFKPQNSISLQVILARNRLGNRPPLLVKLAPDLTQDDKEDIAAVVTEEKVYLACDVVN